MELFEKLTPLVQLTIILSCFFMLLLVTCSRTAATNLVRFLQDLQNIYFHKQEDRFPHQRESNNKSKTNRKIKNRMERQSSAQVKPFSAPDKKILMQQQTESER